MVVTERGWLPWKELPLAWAALAVRVIETSGRILKALTAGPLEFVNDRQNLGKPPC